jgi:hypothetical protein
MGLFSGFEYVCEKDELMSSESGNGRLVRKHGKIKGNSDF